MTTLRIVLTDKTTIDVPLACMPDDCGLVSSLCNAHDEEVHETSADVHPDAMRRIVAVFASGSPAVLDTDTLSDLTYLLDAARFCVMPKDDDDDVVDSSSTTMTTLMSAYVKAIDARICAKHDDGTPLVDDDELRAAFDLAPDSAGAAL